MGASYFYSATAICRWRILPSTSFNEPNGHAQFQGPWPPVTSLLFSIVQSVAKEHTCYFFSPFTTYNSNPPISRLLLHHKHFGLFWPEYAILLYTFLRRHFSVFLRRDILSFSSEFVQEIHTLFVRSLLSQSYISCHFCSSTFFLRT